MPCLQCTYQWQIQDFPEVGAPTPEGGTPTYDFAKISQKLHEIERIWTLGGGRPKFYYVDPPLPTMADSFNRTWNGKF